MAATAGPYSAQLVTLYALLIADVVINATADANAEPLSRFSAISYLVIQLVVRVLCVFNTIGLLGSSGTWYDEVLLRYCGVFVVSLSGLIICLFLRVYRVTLVAFPSRFPTVLEYFADLPYVLLLVGHTMASLLFYYCARCLSMHTHTFADCTRTHRINACKRCALTRVAYSSSRLCVCTDSISAAHSMGAASPISLPGAPRGGAGAVRPTTYEAVQIASRWRQA